MFKKVQKYFLLIIPVLLFLFFSCEKPEEYQPDPTNELLVFNSLTSERDPLEPGESTNITALASGYKLSYNWSASLGNILGSGSDVVYAVSPCHVGRNKILCVIKDGNNQSESKTIYIVVQ
ncbi:MAG: hypothetical protein HQ541_22675 [Mariniphaga sp.]|nr:hypothetical protein [Mariniphaga sp.]